MTQEKKINIAELLKDCQNGMELDCILFENPVKYESSTEGGNYPISIRTEEGELFYLTKEGYIYDRVNSKCVIFPKGKTTWEGFQRPFKDGDIIANNAYIAIFHKCGKPDSYISNNVVYHCWYSKKYKDFKSNKDYGIGRDCDYRFATEEEIRKLFDAIKANGYKWNSETKTLEKLIKPKFKVGDKIRERNKHEVFLVSEVCDNHYHLDEKDISLPFHKQDDWELVPNKFDITTLIPFESRVLVRDDDYGEWKASFWGYIRHCDIGYKYDTVRGPYKQCIPFECNQHLLGTTDDCDEFYKTW